MFFGGLTIAINGFSMVFLFFYHRFQWFSMVPDHWSNDAMVSMDRRGLVLDKALICIDDTLSPAQNRENTPPGMGFNLMQCFHNKVLAMQTWRSNTMEKEIFY